MSITLNIWLLLKGFSGSATTLRKVTHLEIPANLYRLYHL